MSEANNRKVESEKNNDLIRRQKQAEMMKNASIKEMIRKQKYDANDRKAMVSTRRGRSRVIDFKFYCRNYKTRRCSSGTD